MTFTPDDVARLHENLKEIAALKAFVGERANLYVFMKTGVNEDIKNGNAFSVQVPNYELFNPDVEILHVQKHDDQYGGGPEYAVPREFIFGPLTKEEEEFELFLKLKDKFVK